MKEVQKELDGKDQVTAEVIAGEKHQHLCVIVKDEPILALMEGGVKLRTWPLHAVRVLTDQPGGNIIVEAGGEVLTWTCNDELARKELGKAASAVSSRPLSEAALGALLEDASVDDADAEQWVKRLGERLAKLDALNVGGMLAAATEGGGARLAERLEAGSEASAALMARLRRCEALAKGAPDAVHARSGAARAEKNARSLLTELDEIFKWLDPPALKDIDNLSEISLTTGEGRARALAAADALRTALRAERDMPSARRRLGAVRERLRRLSRAKDQLAASLARHLNNLLIHLGNEAAHESKSHRHHLELLQYAPFMRWLKDMDEKAYDALTKVYVGTWSRVYEREVRAACDVARGSLSASAPEKADELLDNVLTLVESICNAEQEFCTQFFHLDVDVKSDSSDGEKSEKSDGGDGTKRLGSETRRLMGELFPALEQELVTLVSHIEKQDTYGAMRALACVSRRVLGTGEAGGAGAGAGGGAAPGGGGAPGGGAAGGAAPAGGWALAAVAVAAKRGADRFIAERLAALPDQVKQAGRKPKCGLLPFLAELEELSGACEAIFAAGGRRADLDRWYVALAAAMVQAVHAADHPRTPAAVLRMENYHKLHAILSALRVPALDSLKRECRTRYTDSLRAYVTQYFGRPLEKLTQFFEGVAEAVATGVREDEVCYRAAFSKHELRRLLAMYPPNEVRKSLHRLYRTVEKHLSEEGGLLQVVWRAMQEEFIAQHVALQARIAACYPGAGLSMPLTTQDILEAFSDIAREH